MHSYKNCRLDNYTVSNNLSSWWLLGVLLVLVSTTVARMQHYLCNIVLHLRYVFGRQAFLDKGNLEKRKSINI